MQTFIKTVTLAATVIILLQQQTTYAQTAHSEALRNADTTHFSVNGKSGWQMYNSYVAAAGKDSIRLELILQRDDNIKWDEWQQVGVIKPTRLRPTATRKMATRMQQAELEVEVRPDGKCYVRLAAGDLQQMNQVVIPFVVVFKK